MLGLTWPWDWSQHTIDLLIAFGTIAAAVVAVVVALAAYLRGRLHRPSLTLSHDAESDRNIEAVGNNNPSTFVRLGVSNERGKHAAEDVQVFVVAVGGARVNFGPLGWTHIREPDPLVGWVPGTKQTLGPGIRRTVDLGSAKAVESVFVLAVSPAPFSGVHQLQHGIFDLVVAVSPRNADAQHFALTLSFENWTPGGLRITKPPKPTQPPPVASRSGEASASRPISSAESSRLIWPNPVNPMG